MKWIIFLDTTWRIQYVTHRKSNIEMNSVETRLTHLRELEMAGIDPYPAEFPWASHSCSDILSGIDELEGHSVQVQGRLVAKRDHGRIVFFDLEDEKDRLQIVWRKRSGEEDNGEHFELVRKNFDPGDFVSVWGDVIRTKKGVVSIDAGDLMMLAKALEDLPTIHSLQVDREAARKRRYLELMVDSTSRERFRMRARMLQMMREELVGLGYLEVETPVLDTVYGGALAKPFVTHMNALGNREMFLRVSPELYLKRLVAGTQSAVFEVSRSFRNEGMDRTHNPEFTLLEAYRPFSDYREMMEVVEGIFERIAVDIHGTTELDYAGQKIDLKAPWQRVSVFDGLRGAYGLDPELADDDEVRDLARVVGVDKPYFRRDDFLLALFEKYYDDKLIQPTFVIDYPRETSPLAKQHRHNVALAERFECVMAGMKVMNGYTELNDSRDQSRRFREEASRMVRGYPQAMVADDDYLRAMRYGFPPMGGVGIAVDRMAMVITNTPNIRDIILFPQVRER